MSAPEDRRFRFGRNWQRFSRLIDEDRIQSAMGSLQAMLERESLSGRSFVDVGCGSGLFSLAARRLGADVRSFDYDEDSVRCTAELRAHRDSSEHWTVEQGSVLDEPYLHSLGKFDIVYSWGVLHHTGDMWRACELITQLVKPGGTLFVAIYNDMGRSSRSWWWTKYAYSRSGPIGKAVLLVSCGLWMHVIKRVPSWTASLLRGRLPGNQLKPERGMSALYDLVDWVGGYPYEVARPSEIFDFYRERGFALRRLVTRSGHGNNEFVFERTAEPQPEALRPGSAKTSTAVYA